MADTSINGAAGKKSKYLALAPFVLPTIMAIIFAWGTNQATNAVLQNRVLTLEGQVAALQKQAESNRSRFDAYVTIEEFNHTVSPMASTLNSVQNNQLHLLELLNRSKR